jgi:hypothetical protein
MRTKRNGILVLDKIRLPQMIRELNTCKCPLPLATNSRERIGVTLERYRQYWPAVKWVSTLG